jgi:hypothetical protein
MVGCGERLGGSRAPSRDVPIPGCAGTLGIERGALDPPAFTAIIAEVRSAMGVFWRLLPPRAFLGRLSRRALHPPPIISCLKPESFFYCEAKAASGLTQNKSSKENKLCGLQNSAIALMLVMWRGGAVNGWSRPAWRSRM